MRNTRYSFLFIREQSMKTAHGVFLQRIRIDNVPMVKVKLVSNLNKIQRRDYYRVGCRIDMRFQLTRMRTEDFQKPNYMKDVYCNLDDRAWKEGTILDISGGGMKFVSEAPIMDMPIIVASFRLPIENEDKIMVVCGRILSRRPVPRTLLCTYRVKFEPERSKAQNDILSYVYAQQCEIVRKEQDK